MSASNSCVEAPGPDAIFGAGIFGRELDFYEVMKVVSHGGIVCMPSLSDQFFAILCTVACQTRLSMGFSRQECWSGLPGPPPGDLPDSGIEPTSLMSPALAGGFLTASATWEAD